MWTVPTPSLSSKKPITPTIKKVNAFVQKLEATNLSTPRPGAWPETPGRRSAKSPSLTGENACTPSSGRGVGGPGNCQGAPVVVPANSTLCATVRPECRTAQFQRGTSKTTVARVHKTANQWERAEPHYNNEMQKCSEENGVIGQHHQALIPASNSRRHPLSTSSQILRRSKDKQLDDLQ